LLFTDVEGSTRLLHELGDGYVEVLAAHRRVLREAFAAHGGVEVDTQGDAFFYAFARASDALAAAEAGQAALDGGPVRVRMGVHTGEPTVTSEGYVGMDVHRAARVMAVGHGGQIVLSDSTARLAGEVALRDLGEHRLKDLTAPVRLHQLGDGDFPPLRSLNATNLPVAASALVGRRRELHELLALFRGGTRLVTLTGPGGSGKTRLGLQVAAELLDDFPGGVFFAPLAGVSHAELVAPAIAAAIGVRDLRDLRERAALILVDNLEHLLEGAPAIGELLGAAPVARVLATSRAPLRIAGEQEYPVDPLPDDDAVELLTQRARAVRPGFEPDAAAHEICRRLDGLPLALELVAPRLRSLGPAALLERLDRRLPLLTAGRRDAPERQRTLRATIEWSHELLEPPLRHMLARLTVFGGTFSLEAAQKVAGATFDDLDALVEASLLKPVGADRFVMLQTIREFAGDWLEGTGEPGEVRLRHAEFFIALAQAANLNIEAAGPMRHDLVIPEHDNFRAALDWTLRCERAQLGLRLAVALENFWMTTDPSEGRRWLEALLARAPAGPSTLHALGVRSLGNTVVTDDAEAGERLYQESFAEFRLLGDELRAATTLHRVASVVASRGDPDRARRLLDECLESHRRTGFAKGEASCLGVLAGIEEEAGAPERALEHYDRGIVLARESGFVWWEGILLVERAHVLCTLERLAEAGESACAALEIARRIGHRAGRVWGVAAAARVAAERGEDERAGRLWGAIEADIARAPLAGWDRQHDALAAPIFAQAGPRFETARAGGHLLSLEDAVAAALEAARG
jgi:predicted ATPase